MRALFDDIPEHIKVLTEFWTELALQQKNPYAGARMVQEFINSCSDKYYQDYIDFVFRVKMEKNSNENISD